MSEKGTAPAAGSGSPAFPPAGFHPLQRAFTMVEIAICLAVIGFALVAIIGVLPSAMNFQRDNREETIIDQDATYWMEAIRDAAKGLDHLTNHVDQIVIHYTNNTPPVTFTHPRMAQPAPHFFTGYEVVGLLTSAALWNLNVGAVEADVHAISGPAVERDPVGRELGLKYRMRVEIVPFTVWNPDLLPEERAQGPDLTNAILHEVRLQFNWPFRPNGPTRTRKVYRSLAQGVVTNEAAAEFSFFDR